MQDDAAANARPLLTCWKDIADYMGKGVRTVQRWEQQFDLPVRRPRGNGYKSSVVARPADLDLWLASKWARRGERDLETPKLDFPGGSRLSDTIKVSRQLCAEHREQVARLRLELQALVQNCNCVHDLRGGCGRVAEQ